MDLGELKVRISADIAKLSQGLQQAQSKMISAGAKMQSVGSSMQGVGMKMSLGVTAPLLLMGKIGVEELGSIEKANANTASSLARIGAKSLVSVGGVQKLAGALQRKSGIDDQVIQSGANMLLTLGSIDTKTKEGKKTFETATKSMVDFAEATGTDAAAAGKLYAKSMAAANQGTILLPKGVKLSEEAMSKLQTSFDKAGSAGERQALVAEALGQKFAGAAKLTSTEKWAVMQDQLAGIAAGIVEQLMPAVSVLTEKIGDWAAKFEALSPTTKKVIAIVAALAAVMGPVLIVVGTLVGAIGALMPVFAALLGPVGLIIIAIVALVAACVLLWRNSETVRDGVTAAWEGIKSGVTATLEALKATVTVWVDWAKSFWAKYGEAISAYAEQAWSAISRIISGYLTYVKGFIQTAMALIRGDWSGAWEGIKTMLSGAWEAIKGIVSFALTNMKATLELAWKAYKAAVQLYWDAISAVISGVWEGIKSGVSGALGSIKESISNTWSSIRTGASSAWNGIETAITNAIKSAPGAVVALFAKLPGDLAELATNAGKSLGSALASAIKSIRLPSISIDMKSFTIPGTDTGFQVPSGISWNAAGGIFSGAQIIGVGEAGAEALVPLGNSASDKRNRANVMREAGLSGSGMNLEMHFHTPKVDIWAVSRQALFAVQSAGFGA